MFYRPPAALRLRRLVRWRALALLGPAFVAAVAYVDPGNVATNIVAGSSFGYLLGWVVVASSALAVLVQYLAAKLGLATGRSLAEHCATRYRRPAVVLLWAQAQLVAVATDLAEIVGGALGLHLLFGWPLLTGGLVTGLLSLALLLVHSSGRRAGFERALAGLLALVAVGFVASAVAAGPDPAALAGGLVPRFATGPDQSTSVLLAAGILGATVMPHAVYAHSALVRDRFRLTGPATSEVEHARRARLLTATRHDITLALTSAGLVNLAILVLGAALAGHGVGALQTLQGAHHTIATVLGPAAAVLFGGALLVSGLASTTVGTYAGAVVTEGFTRRRVPPLAQRLITLGPALLLLASGLDLTRALVLSQVVLALGLPFALFPLVRLTGDRAVMGRYANRRVTAVAALATAILVTALDVALVVITVAR